MSSDESKGDMVSSLFASMDTREGDSNATSSCNDDFPACSEMFSTAWACIGATNQGNHVYKYGEFEDCNARFADWRKCLYSTSAKSLNNPDKAREIYESSDVFKQKHHINDILPMKKKPSWAIDEDNPKQQASVEQQKAIECSKAGWDYLNLSSYIWPKN